MHTRQEQSLQLEFLLCKGNLSDDRDASIGLQPPSLGPVFRPAGAIA